jgi:hypothetical protein
MFSAKDCVFPSEMCGESFDWNGLVAYPAQNRDMNRLPVRTCRTVVNVSSAEPDQTALRALEKSALLCLISQFLWRKGFEIIHAHIV